jgi:hypothetical protein
MDRLAMYRRRTRTALVLLAMRFHCETLRGWLLGLPIAPPPPRARGLTGDAHCYARVICSGSPARSSNDAGGL